jgi:hypothetical protein
MALAVRDATSGDYAAFVRLFPALGVPDPLLTTSQFETQMLPRAIVAEEGDTLGYAHWRFYGPTAHVAHVVVEGDARLADALLATGAKLTFELLRMGAPLDRT